MSSSENYTIIILGDITIAINRYFTILIFLFGVIGNILNFLVFTQRNLRTNSCSWFFLISSIFNLISILFGLTTRILSGWDMDPTETINWVCKLRSYILFSSRTNAFWLITFATIDRWLSSCTNIHYRQMSTLRNARKISFLLIFICCLIHTEIFYCYEANLPSGLLKCYGMNSFCRQLNDTIYISLTVLLPLFLMLIFGLLTILNVRQTRRRVQMGSNIRNPTIANRQDRLFKKKIDHHLFKMLIVEIILLTFFMLPQAIHKLYTTITNHENKSQYDITVDNFLYRIVLLFTFIASGIPFYIYTLCGGDIFRKALLKIFK